MTRHVTFGPREQELVFLIAAGMTENQCAEAMGISPSTVKGTADQIRFKLGVQNRRQIPMAFWQATGIDPFPKDEEAEVAPA